MPECCGVVIVFALPRDLTPGRGGRLPYIPLSGPPRSGPVNWPSGSARTSGCATGSCGPGSSRASASTWACPTSRTARTRTGTDAAGR